MFSSWTGFEPVREYPIGFRVQRLNHSAIMTLRKERRETIFSNWGTRASQESNTWRVLDWLFIQRVVLQITFNDREKTVYYTLQHSVIILGAWLFFLSFRTSQQWKSIINSCFYHNIQNFQTFSIYYTQVISVWKHNYQNVFSQFKNLSLTPENTTKLSDLFFKRAKIVKSLSF